MNDILLQYVIASGGPQFVNRHPHVTSNLVIPYVPIEPCHVTDVAAAGCSGRRPKTTWNKGARTSPAVSGIHSTNIVGDSDDKILSVCFKEYRLILLAPWQEEDCLRTEDFCAVQVLRRWYVTSRTWSKIYWTLFYAMI
jgi:hypothetical protein